MYAHRRDATGMASLEGLARLTESAFDELAAALAPAPREYPAARAPAPRKGAAAPPRPARRAAPTSRKNKAALAA
jgi:hypothetical protein